LESVAARLAVISVGPNQFGHPAPWVIEVLESAGARVLRTDEIGDVVVPLG
jgi:competence protein ComEC